MSSGDRVSDRHARGSGLVTGNSSSLCILLLDHELGESVLYRHTAFNHLPYTCKRRSCFLSPLYLFVVVCTATFLLEMLSYLLALYVFILDVYLQKRSR